jgi:hypothetical protein
MIEKIIDNWFGKILVVIIYFFLFIWLLGSQWLGYKFQKKYYSEFLDNKI